MTSNRTNWQATSVLITAGAGTVLGFALFLPIVFLSVVNSSAGGAFLAIVSLTCGSLSMWWGVTSIRKSAAADAWEMFAEDYADDIRDLRAAKITPPRRQVRPALPHDIDDLLDAHSDAVRDAGTAIAQILANEETLRTRMADLAEHVDEANRERATLRGHVERANRAAAMLTGKDEEVRDHAADPYAPRLTRGRMGGDMEGEIAQVIASATTE